AYDALLCGHLQNDSGVIEAPIAKDPQHFPRMSISTTQSKAARSYYQVIERFYQTLADGTRLPLTRVRLTPETGRTHQLRIHCQYIG
ncbi:RNA pseudouridine synthase, partial [Klebsiella oxytoca]